MTSVPFPIFQSRRPVLEGTRQRLAAVGRCRFYPETCDAASARQFQAIVAKSVEQAHLGGADDNDDKTKAARKKLAKESVSLAKTYLEETLQLDVSIVDVEIVLSCQQVKESDGLLATCFLDAGCDAIVVELAEESNDFTHHLDALDAARVPRERLVAHFPSLAPFRQGLAHSKTPLAQLCRGMSVHVSDLDPLSFSLETLTELLGMAETSAKESSLPFRVVVTLTPSSSVEELADWIGKASRFCGETNPSTVALVDPTPEQLGLSFAACMKTDREDGLYTTVVCARSGEALGLVYSSKASIVAALECGRGVYYSRSRRGLWRKGDTSGNYQVLHRMDVDCDGDAIRFTVTQCGGEVPAFCHLGTYSCWGASRGVRHLEETLRTRVREAPPGSYTQRLLEDADLLRHKLVEEAQELAEAEEVSHVTEELADVLYFAMVRAAKAGVTMDDAAAALDRRARKVTRRKGDAKAYRIAAGDNILQKKHNA